MRPAGGSEKGKDGAAEQQFAQCFHFFFYLVINGCGHCLESRPWTILNIVCFTIKPLPCLSSAKGGGAAEILIPTLERRSGDAP
jgi:hypothetical protein